MSLRSRRGIVQTVETMLLISITLVLAMVALAYAIHHVTAQAESAKSLIQISDAQAWYYSSTATTYYNPVLAATIYVTNIGNVEATINSVKVILPAQNCYYQGSANVVVKPGETVPVSLVLKRYCAANVNLPSTAIVHVAYTAGGVSGVVDAPISISMAG